MPRRPTEDFVRHYELLKSRTGNSPNGARAALNSDAQIAVSIRELERLWRLVDEHRRFSKRRFIVQADPRFRRAFDDYEARWKYAVVAMWDWESEQRGEEPLSQELERWLKERMEASCDNARESVGGDQDDVHEWEFDPDKHSASDEIDFAEVILKSERANGDEEYGAACSRAVGAFKWIHETVGLDIGEVERRWREFPVIIVPKQVSDKRGIEDPRSLFGYLTQIRLAYMIGADLAAIAMCRAATEILFRVHFNQDGKTDLTTLIRSTQQRPRFLFLKSYNIIEKVREANAVLHVEKDDIVHRARSWDLIREWVKVQEGMILSVREL
jgi:hypothetical protein